MKTTITLNSNKYRNVDKNRLEKSVKDLFIEHTVTK